MDSPRTPREDGLPQSELTTTSRLLADHELIRRVPLFSTLTPQQARRLAASASKRECRRGALILSPEAEPDAVYVVLSGEVRLVMGRLRGGRQIVLAVLGSGDSFGERALFPPDAGQAGGLSRRVGSTTPQRLGAYAGSAVHLLRLEADAVRACLIESISVSHSLARLLHHRMERAYQRLFDLAGSSAQARLLEALRDLAHRDGPRWVVRARLSARELGMTIGVTREYVSRLLKEMEAGGLLAREADGTLVLGSDDPVADAPQPG